MLKHKSYFDCLKSIIEALVAVHFYNNFQWITLYQSLSKTYILIRYSFPGINHKKPLKNVFYNNIIN